MSVISTYIISLFKKGGEFVVVVKKEDKQLPKVCLCQVKSLYYVEGVQKPEVTTGYQLISVTNYKDA